MLLLNYFFHRFLMKPKEICTIKFKEMESINIQKEVVSVLQLVQELGKKFSKSYLVRILKGDSKFIKLEHQNLKSFGIIQDWSETKIDMLFQHLHHKEYLIRKNHHRGLYEVSERGEKYLQKQSDFWVKEYELKPTKKYYYEAFSALKEERKLQSAEKNCLPYELCSNYQIQQLIILDFKSIEEINENEIFKNWEGQVDWGRMLLVLKNVKSNFYERKKNEPNKTYYKIESLIEQSQSLEKIILELNIKLSTLVRYIEAIHANGKIDLKDWIYKNVDRKNLVKCIEYFTRTKSLKLKEAKEQLKIDYEILRLGRLYYLIQQISVAA